MFTTVITPEEARALVKKEEDHFYDKKSALVGGAKIQKALVAFANADGGELLVGIEDDRKGGDLLDRWTGAVNIEAFNSVLQSINAIEPPPPVTVGFLKSAHSPVYVLRVMVDKSEYVHKTSDGSVYQRMGAQSLPVDDPERVTMLAFAKGAKSFEDFTVDTTIAEEIVDSRHIKEFLK